MPALIVPADEKWICAGAERLRQGRHVAFPTETVYGLGARAADPAAVRQVFAIKGRPLNNPLIVHVSSPAMAASLVAEWSDTAQALASVFWPGPLTLVLPRRAQVPAEVAGGGDSVGVRSPDHPVALALIDALGEPIVGPSANRSGRVSPTTARHVLMEFESSDLLILDGGPCAAGIESTVLSLVRGTPTVLRPGPVRASEIERVLGRSVLIERSAAAAESVAPLESPGRLPSHYAPRARAELLSRGALIARLAQGQEQAVALMYSTVSVPGDHRVVWMPPDPADYAARLYAALRDADALGPEVILIERPPDDEAWSAVLDRLERASAPRDR